MDKKWNGPIGLTCHADDYPLNFSWFSGHFRITLMKVNFSEETRKRPRNLRLASVVESVIINIFAPSQKKCYVSFFSF